MNQDPLPKYRFLVTLDPGDAYLPPRRHCCCRWPRPARSRRSPAWARNWR